MLKVDGELTRRNRMRTEVFSKLGEYDDMLKQVMDQVDIFGTKQQCMISSITKLVYI